MCHLVKECDAGRLTLRTYREVVDGDGVCKEIANDRYFCNQLPYHHLEELRTLIEGSVGKFAKGAREVFKWRSGCSL